MIPFTSHRVSSNKGHSLVELLVIISIIGLITALAIPQIGNLADAANDTVSKRNAQNLSSLSQTLAAFGMEHVIPESLGGVEATCRLIRNGIVVSEGPMTGTNVALPGLSDERIPEAAVYLETTVMGFVLRMVYNNEPDPKK